MLISTLPFEYAVLLDSGRPRSQDAVAPERRPPRKHDTSVSRDGVLA